METLTKAGIWCVTMKAAASLSNLSCRSVDAHSLGGKRIPTYTTQEKCALLDWLSCVFVSLSVNAKLDCIPGEKTFGLNRISKIISLTDPTSLHAARTASAARESSARIKQLI